MVNKFDTATTSDTLVSSDYISPAATFNINLFGDISLNASHIIAQYYGLIA